MPAQPPTAGAARLESLTVGASVAGVDPRGPVRVIQAQWHGADCLDLTYRDATGRTDSRLLYRGGVHVVDVSDLISISQFLDRRHKLVIFTEHRDTLTYLARRICRLLGRDEAVVTIAGGMPREERRKAQEAFTLGRNVQILVATNAAGEGINLQLYFEKSQSESDHPKRGIPDVLGLHWNAHRRVPCSEVAEFARVA